MRTSTRGKTKEMTDMEKELQISPKQSNLAIEMSSFTILDKYVILTFFSQ